MRKNDRAIKKTQRDIERERADLERQEKKLVSNCNRGVTSPPILLVYRCFTESLLVFPRPVESTEKS